MKIDRQTDLSAKIVNTKHTRTTLFFISFDCFLAQEHHYNNNKNNKNIRQ